MTHAMKSASYRIARRVVDAMLRRRWVTIAIIVAIAAPLGALSTRVRPGFTVENYFPRDSQVKRDHDRFKREFPHEDALALVVVEAPDLWTPAGVARVRALEADLAAIDGVQEVAGLTSVDDIVGDDIEVRIAPLLPEQPTAADIARQRVVATTDRLFAWKLATPPPPAGPALDHGGAAAGATTIAVTLHPDHAASEETRTGFLVAARQVIAAHGGNQQQTQSAVPVIRSQYNELITRDVAKLFPLALLFIVVLLYASFRSVKVVIASVAVIGLAISWTYGVMGILGYSIEILTTVTPLAVMIIALSDTLHIVAHYRDGLASGHSHREALAEACAETAIPCLLTEVTIGLGFLTLLTVGTTALLEFGIATAAGMAFAWLANMLVLPVALDILRPTFSPRRRTLADVLGRFTGWLERVSALRARTIVIAAVAIVTVACALATRVERRHRSFGDLPADHPVMRDIAYAERLYGGVVPLMVHIEPPGDDRAGEPMFEPEAIALMARVQAFLERQIPEVTIATSAADLWRKTYRAMAPEQADKRAGLPPDRATAAQLYLVFDDPKLTRNTLAGDLGSAAVVAMLPNVDSVRGAEILHQLETYLAAEQAATGYRLSATGLFANLADINQVLLDGMASSLAWALAVTFAVFILVLRSVRLALLAMIPNVLPLAIGFGFMGLCGIDITPSTVVVCAIVLTIADDDTIQFFARFREFLARRLRERSAEPEAAAAADTMRAVGTPMILTATVVSIGFLTLAASTFNGLVQLGLITGVSLLSAMFADLFLSPLLVRTLGRRRRPSAIVEPPR